MVVNATTCVVHSLKSVEHWQARLFSHRSVHSYGSATGPLASAGSKAGSSFVYEDDDVFSQTKKKLLRASLPNHVTTCSVIYAGKSLKGLLEGIVTSLFRKITKKTNAILKRPNMREGTNSTRR